MATPPINVPVNFQTNTTPLYKGLQGFLNKAQKPVKIPLQLPLGQITGEFKQFEKSLDAAVARVISFTATTKLIFGVADAFRAVTKSSIEVEHAMTRIASLLETTSSETKSFQKDLFNLANATATGFYEVADAAEEFARQGLSIKKTLEATSAAAVLARLSGTDLKRTIEGLTAIMSSSADEGLEFVDVANKLAAVDANFATSGTGLIEGLKRFGSVAKDNGLILDEQIAILASIKQLTGRSEAVIGNSIKSIISSFGTERSQKDLEAIGVAVKDNNGEFRNAMEVGRDLANVFDSLNASQREFIKQRVGGKYQANAFQGFINSFKSIDGGDSLVDKALKTSAGAGDDAQNRIDKLNESTKSAIQVFKNNLEQFGAGIGDKIGKPMIESLTSFANNFFGIFSGDKATQVAGGAGEKIGKAIAGGIGQVLSGPALAIGGFILFKFTKRILADSVKAIQGLIGIEKIKKNITALDQIAVSQIQPQLLAGDLKRIALLGTQEAKERAILQILNQQIKARDAANFANTFLQTVPGVRQYGQKYKTRAGGEVPALVREAVDIQNGVGGARPTARPKFAHLNLGKGVEKVVVNSDEKIVKNYANSGQDAVLNRSMMGYAGGRVPFNKRLLGSGVDADVFKVGGKTAIKQFRYPGNPGVVNEFLISRYAKSKGLPIAGVFGSLKEAKAKDRILKEYIGSNQPYYDTSDYFRSSASRARKEDNPTYDLPPNNPPPKKFHNYSPAFLEKEFAHFGIKADDIAGNDANVQTDNRGKAKVVDAGEFRVKGKAYKNIRRHIGKADFLSREEKKYLLGRISGFKRKNLSSGYIPNLASGLTPQQQKRNRQRAQQRAARSVPPPPPLPPLPPRLGPPLAPLPPRPSAPPHPAASYYPPNRLPLPAPSRPVGNPYSSISYPQQRAANQQAQKERRAQRSGRLVGAGFGASFIGGIAAESLRGKDGESTRGQRITESSSNSLGISLAVAGLNPIAGLAVGIATGMNTLNKAMAEFETPLDKITQEQSNLTKKYTEQAASVDGYVVALNSLEEAIASGSARAKKAAEEKLGEALGGISDPDLKKQLEKAKTDADAQVVKEKNERITSRELEQGKFTDDYAKYRVDENPILGNAPKIGSYIYNKNVDRESTFAGALTSKLQPGDISDDLKNKLKSSEGIDIGDVKNLTNNSALKRYIGEDTNAAPDIVKAVSERLKQILKGGETASKISDNTVDSTKLFSVVSSSLDDILLKESKKRAEAASSLDSFGKELELASAQMSELGRSQADYLFNVSKTKQELYNAQTDVKNDLLKTGTEIIGKSNLTGSSANDAKAALQNFSDSGDFSKFQAELKKAIGAGSTKKLEDLAAKMAVNLKDLSAKADIQIQADKENAAKIAESIIANQATDLYGGSKGFAETLKTAKEGLRASFKKPTENKISNSLLTPTGDVVPYNQNSFSKKSLEITREKGKNARTVLDGLEAERAAGLFNIPLSENSPQTSIDARDRFLESTREKAKKAFSEKRNADITEETGQKLPIYLKEINDQFKKESGFGPNDKGAVPLFSDDEINTIQQRAAQGDFSKYDDISSKKPLDSNKFKNTIAAKLEAQDFLTQRSDAQKVTDLGADNYAKTLISGSIDQQLLQKAEQLNGIQEESKNLLKTISLSSSVQTMGARGVMAIAGNEGIEKEIGEREKEKLSILSTLSKKGSFIGPDSLEGADKIDTDLSRIGRASLSPEENKKLDRAKLVLKDYRSGFKDSPYETNVYKNGKLDPFSRIKEIDEQNAKSRQAIKGNDESTGALDGVKEQFQTFFKSFEDVISSLKKTVEDKPVSSTGSVDVNLNLASAFNGSEFANQAGQAFASIAYDMITKSLGKPPVIKPSQVA